MPYWRNVVCKGCPAECRYRDLRGSGVTFVEVYEAVLKRSREEAASGNYKYRTSRSKILGQMHEQKLRIWEDTVTRCPERIPGNPLWDVSTTTKAKPRTLPIRLEAMLVAMGEQTISVGDASELLLCSRGAAHKTLVRLARSGHLFKVGKNQYRAFKDEVPF